MAWQGPMGYVPQRVRMRGCRAHPGVSCNENALRFVPAAYLRALPVYLPVYLLSGLLVHRHAPRPCSPCGLRHINLLCAGKAVPGVPR